MVFARKEIERRWIVERSKLPRLVRLEKEEIEQYYTMIFGDSEERMRKINGSYFRTLKSGRGLLRDEAETRSNKKAFNDKKKTRIGSVIRKTRYKLPYAGFQIEIDVFEGSLRGLVVAEVEFRSNRSARSFSPPSWFSREITYDDRYTNRSLALHGLAGLQKGGR